MLRDWFVAACVATVASLSTTAHAAEFEAGVAVSDITPPRGWRMCGYFNERINTGTHDPLSAKALVFRQGKTQAALVFCDLIGLDAGVTAKAREIASKRTGIPAAHILIHGTHSHTGPLYFGTLRNFFHQQALEKQGKDPHEPIDYSEFLAEKMVDAISAAQAEAKPVSLTATTALQRGLSFNRRFHMKDGSVRFNPGKLNPDMIRPAGPIDPDLTILFINSAANKKPIAGLSVFALHLDTMGGTEYGADYPFYLERALRTDLGARFVSLFGTGTCGDINHVDFSSPTPQKGGDETARIGTALAETVKSEIAGLKPLGTSKLAVRTGVVEVPMQKYSTEEIAQAKRDLFKVGTSEATFLEQVKAVKICEVAARPAILPIEVQTFRLDDETAIVGLPGEVFVEFGLAIKKQSPFARTFVIELCNDTPMYIPTKKAFVEGSYETVNSLAAPGGGEAMTELAVKLLKDLKNAE